MSLPKITLAHHPDCIFEIAWDVAGELGGQCSCPDFWPHQVCTECWMPPKRHLKSCSQWVKPKKKVKEIKSV